MLALLLLHVGFASISKDVEPLLPLVADGTISCLCFHAKNLLSNWLNLFFFMFHCFVAPLFDGIFLLYLCYTVYPVVFTVGISLTLIQLG